MLITEEKKECCFAQNHTDAYTHGGDIYGKAVRFDFSANLNPLGMPASVRQALISNVDSFTAYPDPACRALTEALICFYQNTVKPFHFSPAHIVCGNGAADLIYRIVAAVKPKQALLLAPTFSEYEKALEEAGCCIQFHFLKEADGFLLSGALLKDITPEMDCLFLCSPNNPTGRVADLKLLRRILDVCRQYGTLVVIDECFLDFVENGAEKSAACFLQAYENLIVLKAFTKIYAMAGLRLGYLLCKNTALTDAIRRCGQCWSVSTPAQTAGLAALQETDYIQKTVRYVAQERTYLSQALTEAGCRVFPSEANFLLFYSTLPLERLLLAQGIAIRSCANYRGLSDGFFRIAVRTRQENAHFIKALRHITSCRMS